MEYLKCSGKRKVYSYRRIIPQELREYLGKREVKLSLKTSNRPSAIIAAQLINTQVEAQFGKARESLGLGASDDTSTSLSTRKAFQIAQRVMSGADLYSNDIQDGLAIELIDRAERGVADPIELAQIGIIAGRPAPTPTISEAFDLYREERKQSSTHTSNMKIVRSQMKLDI